MAAPAGVLAQRRLKAAGAALDRSRRLADHEAL